ncbi:hypothetical protein [Sphingopyxis flava]|uniref:Uncharacterized protein n=1 Tax=Sphingopyxis flava TaxID=1507287 RepID=A0A1T5A1F0_9SPHN|nr:hypothetical protein [Sphingopyxis flava]SKB28790.1 hypothetical protein SAMN06295937_100298 [Sphingopyxis flava]
MALQLDASMEPRGGGTRITGTFGRSLAGRIFPYAWYGFLSIFVIIGVLVTSLVPDALLFGAIFAGVPLFMTVVGGAAMKAGQSRDEEDRREIMRFLTQELQTRPMA